MKKNNILIQEKTLSFDEVYRLLKDKSGAFTPPICDVMNIEIYANKLAEHANFLICRDDIETVGFTAYYKNENVSQLYVTLVCVDETWQRSGLGTMMFSKLAGLSTDGWHSIGLEVNKHNIKGLNFYIKQGFLIEEDRDKKYLMKKKI